jgi:hypothetical protein
MRKLILMAIISALLSSCAPTEVDRDIFTPGTYKGQLTILSLVDYPPFTVTLTFTADRFSLEGHASINPSHAIDPTCNTGVYKIIGQEIEFTTDCMIPNDIGRWSDAINGKFKLKVNNKRLELVKDSNASYMTVTYKLEQE